jgi:hypothetical protein
MLDKLGYVNFTKRADVTFDLLADVSIEYSIGRLPFRVPECLCFPLVFLSFSAELLSLHTKSLGGDREYMLFTKRHLFRRKSIILLAAKWNTFTFSRPRSSVKVGSLSCQIVKMFTYLASLFHIINKY